MNLKNQVCSIEYSMQLNELGIKQDSLFYYLPIYDGSNQILYFRELTHSLEHYISAFIASELGEMLPFEIGMVSASGSTKPIVSQKNPQNIFCIYIQNPNGTAWPIFGDDNEANARAQMLIYLIENKMIEVPF